MVLSWWVWFRSLFQQFRLWKQYHNSRTDIRLCKRQGRTMRSYKSYFILILVPYVFLICMFHTQLQMYDRSQSKTVISSQGVLGSNHLGHSNPLLLYPVIANLSRFRDTPLIPPSKKKASRRNLSQDTPKQLDYGHHDNEEWQRNRKQMVLERLKHSNIKMPVFNGSEPFIPSLGSTTMANSYVNARLKHCKKSNNTDYPGFQTIQSNYIYSAFYDNRQNGPPVVRIITLLKTTNRPLLFCHFANPKSLGTVSSPRYLTVMATYYEMCENHAKDYGGWMLTCEALYDIIPCEVFISQHSQFKPESPKQVADGIVKVPVIMLRNPDSPKSDFGLCVPPLFGYIPSTTLIEFVELSKILGVDHIVFYAHEVPREIQKVLHFYQQSGAITVVRWNLPVKENSIWYHGQLLAINDCLYRSMHRFKYLAFNDIDEFFVPHMHANWTSMIRDIQNAAASPAAAHAGYVFQSAFFDPLIDTSSHVLYDLESDLRTKAFSKVRTKALVVADRIHELGIHHISKPTHDHFQIVPVEPEVAFLHHYRKCVTDFDPRMNCQVFARDESISQYIPILRHNVHQSLWILKETEKLSYRDKYMRTR